MNSRLAPITLTLQGQAAADNIHGVQLPYSATLVGLSAYIGAFSGSPTNLRVDVKAGTAEILTDAVTIVSAGSGAQWKTTHFGGANSPLTINANTNLSIDIKFTGGTSPTATGEITLWLLMNEL